MTTFFDINSVAIVWASSIEWKIGNSLLQNLSIFEWKKYWVNPKWGEYEGIEFYKSISDLPIIPDVLVFSIPSKFVLSSLIEAWKFGVKRVIVISAGFKEVWNIELENELIEIAKKYNIEILWPNCLWYVDTAKNLNLSFWAQSIHACTWKECNNIAMVSQSWAMAVALTDWANSRKIGFSKMISMWNKAWINENDLLNELEKDIETKVISLYLESIEKWEEFSKITKKLSKKYPIILVKSWVSERWSAAASSHTWALASQKEVLETAFKNSWIHYTQSLENFFLWSQIFSKTDLDKVPDELVIITNAWGPWVMATDHTENYNVKLTEFTDKEKTILKEWLPDAASVNNPIDIIWDATSKTYSQILNNLSKIVKKRAILVMLTAQSITDVENIANTIIDFKIANPDEFIMVSFMGWEWVEKWREILSNAWILEYDYPKKAISAFSRLIIQKDWQEKKNEEEQKFELPVNLEELKIRLFKEKKFAKNDITQDILDSFWITISREIIVKSREEAKKTFRDINDITIARISSPDIPHKSDVWGVVFSITNEDEATNAYDTIMKNIDKNVPNAFINGIVYSKMLKSDASMRDIFVWFKRDESFWNILIVWMWGIYVNVLEDVTRRIWLVSRKEIDKMFTELKAYPILKWVRWEEWIAFEKLVENVFRLQFIFQEFKQIKEIDINPILTNHNESVVVDAKFYL